MGLERPPLRVLVSFVRGDRLPAAGLETSQLQQPRGVHVGDQLPRQEEVQGGELLLSDALVVAEFEKKNNLWYMDAAWAMFVTSTTIGYGDVTCSPPPAFLLAFLLPSPPLRCLTSSSLPRLLFVASPPLRCLTSS
eukprot:702269-Hanusia_phi.AAC.1